MDIPHLKARLTLLPTAEGGRQSPIASGYCPHFRYEDQENGVLVLLDRDWLFPEETADVGLVFLRPELQRGRLSLDTSFEVREGARAVARGTIVEICDEDLGSKKMA